MNSADSNSPSSSKPKNAILKKLWDLNPKAELIADREFDAALSGIGWGLAVNGKRPALAVYSQAKVAAIIRARATSTGGMHGILDQDAVRIAAKMFDHDGPNAPRMSIDYRPAATAAKKAETHARRAKADQKKFREERKATAGPKKQQPGCEDIGEVVKLRYEAEREHPGKGGIHLVAGVRLENGAKVIAYAPPNVTVHPGDQITIRLREKMGPPIAHIRYEVGSNVTTGQVEYRDPDRAKPAATRKRDALTEAAADHCEANGILKELSKLNPAACVLADREFDDAILGIHTQKGWGALCVYSEARIVKILQNRGLSEWDAFNTACDMFSQADAEAWPNAPIRILYQSKGLIANRIAELTVAAEACHAKNAPPKAEGAKKKAKNAVFPQHIVIRTSRAEIAKHAPTDLLDECLKTGHATRDGVRYEIADHAPAGMIDERLLPAKPRKPKSLEEPRGSIVIGLKSGHVVVAHCPESMRANALQGLTDRRIVKRLIGEVPPGDQTILPNGIRYRVVGFEEPTQAAARPQLELAL